MWVQEMRFNMQSNEDILDYWYEKKNHSNNSRELYDSEWLVFFEKLINYLMISLFKDKIYLVNFKNWYIVIKKIM